MFVTIRVQHADEEIISQEAGFSYRQHLSHGYVYVDCNVFSCEEGEVDVGHAQSV